MAYSKTTWANNTAPAINADNLNKIENGIYNAHNSIDTLDTEIAKKATTSQLGRVKVDGTTITANSDGVISASSSGGGTWGSITGTLSNQTDLQDALDDKVDIVSGKGLSENDYTDADKAIVNSVEDIPILEDITQAAYNLLPDDETGKLNPQKYYNITDAFDIGNITIVDNLNSTSANHCLSANQGRVLKEMIGDIGEALDAINGEVI